MSQEIFVNARFLTQKVTGTQRFAIELSLQLRKIMPELIFVSPDNILHKDIAKTLGVRVIGKIKNGVIWEQIELPLYLKYKGSPLLINFCNTAPLYYRNKIVSIMDLSFHVYPGWFSKSFSTYYNFLIPKIIKSSKGLITISLYSRDDISKYFDVDKARIAVITPSVSDFFTQPIESSTNKQNNKGYLLAVSSKDPRKNFAGLIQAFERCSLKDVKLLIVGNSNTLFSDSGVDEFIKKNKNILFTGYVDDKKLIDLYQNAIAFVYPSYFEGFGIPPLEAMACGCPTIVSNTTSLPEVCGDASIYVNPNDIDSITLAILQVIGDEKLRQLLIKKGFERVKLFSWEKSAVNLMNYVYEVAERE